MSGSTGHMENPTDATMPATSSANDGNGSGQARPPVEGRNTGQHRETPALPTLLRLAVVFVLIVAGGAAAGYYGSALVPKEYAARAELQYKLSKSVPNELLREDRTLTTQEVLLHSMVVLRPVAQENHIAPEHLAKNISADVVDNTEIVEVELRDQSPERAQELLSAVVDAYLVAANRDWQDPVRAYIEAQIAELENQLQGLQGQQLRPGLSPERTTELLQWQRDLTKVVEHFRESLSKAPASMSEPPARVLTAAYQVAEPVRPRPLLNAAAGAAAAFVLAALVVLIIARRRPRS
jgi:capsular polysaccharide biosynthesis protein